MKSALIGYAGADSWKFAFSDVSIEKRIIALKGELRAGFFHAYTPMYMAPGILSKFANDVRKLDETLKGSATLENKNNQSAIRLTLAANHVGHIMVTGRYEINGNSLDFSFRTDQTQLGPFIKGLESFVHAYENAAI